jgi:hypothetical protein
MKERGILFTPANIKLIRDKRKWQTRRVIVPQPELTETCGFSWKGHVYGMSISGGLIETGRFFAESECRYGKRGDRLYIKEGVITHVSIPQLVGYYMDGCRVTEQWEKRLTAMFMAKRYARTWLEITDVRVERLQDISEEDAEAEGIDDRHKAGFPFQNDPCIICGKKRDGHVGRALACFGGHGTLYDPRTYRGGYAQLWDSINKKKHPWESNPWVFAITFRKV